MIQLDYAEVIWELSAFCQFKCDYCRPEWKNGTNDHSVEEYLSIVEKLQATRYQHHNKISWHLGGGEPLHFPNLSTLLKKIKEQPSTIHIHTSGDDNWFSAYGILNYIDAITLTYHHWQNDDVVGFILDEAKEKNIKVSIIVPLVPGQIYESREKVQYFRSLGYECNEQILHNANGELYIGYNQVDSNRIHGRPDNWQPVHVVRDPNLPDPNYIDLRIVNDTDPVYTGKPCYAGVDWIYINHKGFASYSQCGGRGEALNVFNPDWQPPTTPFPCNVNQCRSVQDRTKIRILPA